MIPVEIVAVRKQVFRVNKQIHLFPRKGGGEIAPFYWKGWWRKRQRKQNKAKQPLCHLNSRSMLSNVRINHFKGRG